MEISPKKRIPAFCIAGTHSGCGKTTVSLGIMAALTARGYRVQAYKVGPDFIDPGHHRRVTGRDCHNLDSWMLGQKTNEEIFSRYIHDADVAVVEGVMGLFDGSSGKEESGSTALMAKWLGLPVFLVIDARSMARSAAAVAMGFSRFDPELAVSGILFNRVGSRGHAKMLEEAMEHLPDLQPYGFLPRESGLEIPARHLGLLTDDDYALGPDRIRDLATWVEENARIDDLLSSARVIQIETRRVSPPARPSVPIAIALDEAFCFYYPENLRLLREAGAELVPFSPIRDQALPQNVKGILLGGGYPEIHCAQLSANRDLLSSIKDFGRKGGPVYAECGGFMYLMEGIVDFQGREYPMAGLFPMRARMEERLHSLGYRDLVTRRMSPLGSDGIRIRGHEFHYSRIDRVDGKIERIYSMKDRHRAMVHEEGYLLQNVLGSYVHQHWGSNPDVARHIVDFCRKNG